MERAPEVKDSLVTKKAKETAFFFFEYFNINIPASTPPPPKVPNGINCALTSSSPQNELGTNNDPG